MSRTRLKFLRCLISCLREPETRVLGYGGGATGSSGEKEPLAKDTEWRDNELSEFPVRVRLRASMHHPNSSARGSRPTIAWAATAVVLPVLIASFLVSRNPGKPVPNQGRNDEIHTAEIGAVPDSDVTWMHFADRYRGWASSHPPALFRTDDGGKHWLKLGLPDLSAYGSDYMSNVKFFDRNSGHLLGGTYFYQTSDGGDSWSRYPLPQRRDLIEGVDAVSVDQPSRRVWAAGTRRRPVEKYFSAPNWAVRVDAEGKWSVSEAVIMRTENGGDDWELVYSGSPHDLDIEKIAFWDSNTGVAVGDTTLVRTNNGGKTWEDALLPDWCVDDDFSSDNGMPLDLFLLDGGLGWLSFQGGFLLKTTDGGRTWCQAKATAQDGQKGSFTALYFRNPDEGIAIGDWTVLLTTRDGGENWRITRTGGFVRSFCPLNPSTMIVATDTQLLRVEW